MNLHLLRIYVAVVNAKSFSRAAENLDISQPAASKAVRELESQLDTVLLERQGRTFQPTEPGRALYDYGRSIFALELKADEAIRSFCALEQGQLTIGASTTIATYWLPPILVDFQRRYPAVEVRVVSANTRQIAELLLDCKIDVALIEGAVADERFDIRPWRSEQMVIVGPKQSRRKNSPALESGALADQVWIVRESGSGSRAATDRLLSSLGVAQPKTVEVGSNEAIVQTVASGMGLGLVPKICARDQLALGRVQQIPVEHGVVQRELYRMRLPHRPISHAALAFEALLAA